MNVIPVINCPDKVCAEAKARVLGLFYPIGSFVHIDITDGAFSVHRTWNDPLGWRKALSPFLMEVHLMVEHPLEYAGDWLAAGAKRLVVHAETVTSGELRQLFDLADANHAEVMVSSGPGADPDTFIAPLIARFGAERFTAFQVLAVPPGAAGQSFKKDALLRVSSIRALVPHAIIEVDGGMDPATARLVKDAGADTVVSATYIFHAPNPKKAYEELRRI